MQNRIFSVIFVIGGNARNLSKSDQFAFWIYIAAAILVKGFPIELEDRISGKVNREGY